MDDFKKFAEEIEKLTNQRFVDLDASFIVDCLLEMSNDYKESTIKWLATNVSHRLKLKYCTTHWSRNKWISTVNRTIDDLELRYKRNPSLKSWNRENFDEVWDLAKKDYNHSRREWGDLPEIVDFTCPWSFEELLKPIE